MPREHWVPRNYREEADLTLSRFSVLPARTAANRKEQSVEESVLGDHRQSRP